MPRHAEFNRDNVIDQATSVFWERGYARTSVGDLVSATGLQPGSLYAAFGNKKGLFLEVIDRYNRGFVGRIRSLRDAPGRSIDKLEGLLQQVVEDTAAGKANHGCLTVNALPGNGFEADVSRETLSLTTIGEWRPGAPVNLERALTLDTPLGGHLVSGHVDGIGRVLERRDDGIVVPMSTTHSSVAVILNAGGAHLDLTVLGEMPVARVISAEIAWGEQAACIAATLEHECDVRELAEHLRSWATGRGWSVTVAPLPRPG